MKNNNVVSFSNEQEKQIRAAREKCVAYYEAIFAEIRQMLVTAKLNPMESLVSRNPSFSELAIRLKEFRELAHQLSKMLKMDLDFEMLDRYIDLAQSMADCIDRECSEGLGEAISALDDMPYI